VGMLMGAGAYLGALLSLGRQAGYATFAHA
jgi:hypothetical protein